MLPPEASLLHIYLRANARWRGVPLYRAIVEKARASQMAGASVFSVELSFGAHRHLHDATSEYTSYDIPVVIEIVDAADRVGTLIDAMEDMIDQGLAVSRETNVLLYAGAAGRYANEIEYRGVDETDDQNPQGAQPKPKDATAMKTQSEARRLTIYIGSSDVWEGQNLALAIVERCRALGIAGATVCRGILGFGSHSVIHRTHLLALSEDLPEKIEIVDTPEKLARLLPALDKMIGGGLVVIEDVRVIRYSREPGAG
jgi:PII-like signaling protein